MADVTIESAVLKDGTLTVTGTGFTKTTTEVKVDGIDVEVSVNSDSEIVARGIGSDAKRVKVTKAGVSKAKQIRAGGDEEEPEEDDTDQTTDFPQQGSADVSPRDMATAANTGAADLARIQKQAMEPDRTNPKPGEHVPAKDFRFRVENTAAGDLNMDPREPYPTGNPPDPREAFYDINGFYPGEGGTGGIAGVKRTDKPNPEA